MEPTRPAEPPESPPTNYGFAPGNPSDKDHFDDALRAMLARRADTELIDKPKIRVLRRFLAHLSGSPRVRRPIRDILIGAHANDAGELFLPLYQGQTGPTTTRHVRRTLDNERLSIRIDDELIAYKPDEPSILYPTSISRLTVRVTCVRRRSVHP